MKKKVEIPRALRNKLLLLRIRAPIDSKHGTDAVQKNVNFVYALMQSYVHRFCREFIAEKHSLLIDASKNATVFSKPEPMSVDESMSIVQYKAKMAEAEAAVNAARKSAERTETAKSDLSVFIDEHCELVASIASFCSASVEKYFAQVSKRMDISKLENPFDEFVFEPAKYHIFSKEEEA